MKSGRGGMNIEEERKNEYRGRKEKWRRAYGEGWKQRFLIVVGGTILRNPGMGVKLYSTPLDSNIPGASLSVWAEKEFENHWTDSKFPKKVSLPAEGSTRKCVKWVPAQWTPARAVELTLFTWIEGGGLMTGARVLNFVQQIQDCVTDILS